MWVFLDVEICYSYGVDDRYRGKGYGGDKVNFWNINIWVCESVIKILDGYGKSNVLFILVVRYL